MRVLRRYGYRVVAAWFAVALVVSVGLDLGVGVKPAGADEASNKSDWVDENSSLVFSSCNWLADMGDKLRSDFFGTITGQIGVGPSMGFVSPSPLIMGGGAAVGAQTGVMGSAGGAGALVGGAAVPAVVGGAAAIGATVAVCGKSLNNGIKPTAKLAGGSYLDTQPVHGGTGVSWSMTAGPQPCINPQAPTDVCVRFIWDAAPSSGKGIYYVKSGPGPGWGYNGGNESLSPSFTIEAAHNGVVGYPWTTLFTGVAGFIQARFPCGTDPTCYQDADSLLWVRGDESNTNKWSTFPGARILAEARGVPWRGQKRRLVSTTWCKVPGGATTTIVEQSPEFWDDEGGPGNWVPEGCNLGRAPTRQKIDRERVGGLEAPVTVTDWNLPTPIANNATSLQCWVKAVLSVCPMYDNNGVTELGGPGGVPVGAPNGATLRTTVTDVLERPPESWFPDEAPVPTTTAPPTTAPPTTGPPPTTPEEGCAAGAPGCPNPSPPDEPDPPDGTGGECWPSGWGWFNPAEWVLRPIKCALVWAFWDQESADEISALGDEHGWTALITESSVTTSTAAGPCVDMDYADICTEPILSAELPSVATVLLTAAVLFFGLFEVIGLFARISAGGSSG